VEARLRKNAVASTFSARAFKILLKRESMGVETSKE
jgi:hypothetical protein